MDKERYRELAVKLWATKVAEGIERIEATLDNGPIKDTRGNTVPSSVTILIEKSKLSITRKTASGGLGGTTIYVGPMLWLKGTIDYDKPMDEQ